ncbi:MAG: D-glycerate dehydrogenase [Actinomycetota bacterium]|nr:D-glycerate dehydrogenase [Actinomycetota bacterium]
MAHVFVTRALPGDALSRLEAAGHAVDVWPEDLPPPPEVLRERVADVEGLLSLLTEKIDTSVLDAAPNLKVIANYAIGSDNIDLEVCRERGIPVGVTPDVLTDATADLAWALMLAVARKLVEGAADVRAGKWKTWEPQGWLGYDVHGATLVVVGAGRIGQAAAKRAQGFDMKVITVDLGDDLHAALAEADFVTLHAPLTEETRGLIGAREFATMPKHAILVNTARGPLIDREALRDALQRGEIAGVALDVTDPEPLPADDPLLDTPNLLVVPHIGSATHGARNGMANRAVDNLLAGLEGKPLPFPVG